MSKLNIRLSSFETNSSSMHTVVLINDNEYHDAKKVIRKYVSKNDLLKNNIRQSDGVYIPVPKDTFGDSYSFGRGFAIYTDWIEKFAYVLASSDLEMIKSIINMLNMYSNEKILGFVSHLTQFEYEDVEISYKHFGKETSLKPVRGFNPYFCAYGTVDHQSTGTLQECIAAMKKTDTYKNMNIEELLYEIIFSKRIGIVEDSDEEYRLDEYISSGLLNANSIQYIMCDGKFKAYDDYYDNKIINHNEEDW